MMTVDEALMKADDANYSSETEITLAAEVRRLSDDVDQLRCQLAGCGVAALENTVGSRSRRAVRGDYGHSSSYEDVCNTVDREIALREENERLRKDAERYQWLRDNEDELSPRILRMVRDGDPDLDSAIDAARSAKTLPEPAP